MTYQTTDELEKQETGIQDSRGGQSLTNQAALSLYATMNACQNPDQLDAVARLMWEPATLSTASSAGGR
jgi:hypothetical protein